MAGELTERERTVLRYVVRDFIETATPIGSRYISKRHQTELNLSSASIRNVMSDLETLGYIDHPHTSAGRVPTDRGYRFYLDSLMELERLSRKEQQSIRQNLGSADDRDQVLREVTKVLGRISRQLCVITPPSLTSGSFEKLELVPISGNRVMVIISIASGLLRTIMMEVASEIQREKLDELSRTINERLAGLSLQEIRSTFAERMREVQPDETGLIRLFIDSVDKLFVPPKNDKVHIAGARDIVEQPEFVNPEDFRSVIELINDEDIIIHILERSDRSHGSVRVTIGGENEDEKLRQYSVIATTYEVGAATGTVGVIGPRRMPYYRVIPLVDYVAKSISDMFNNVHQA
ncbi:MAG TPA: heat-inducible transcriptional repressor HrcA [Bacteroidota bacterium]|nr:heat-inducible transcriptional repressor HrcA [Bacteroidota bacterium]